MYGRWMGRGIGKRGGFGRKKRLAVSWIDPRVKPLSSLFCGYLNYMSTAQKRSTVDVNHRQKISKGASARELLAQYRRSTPPVNNLFIVRPHSYHFYGFFFLIYLID
jgi:hypothetical protein